MKLDKWFKWAVIFIAVIIAIAILWGIMWWLGRVAYATGVASYYGFEVWE